LEEIYPGRAGKTWGWASLEPPFPVADSIVLATARAKNAVIWTQDSDFKGMEGVKTISSKKK
jgi:predicted nuclease of predicted toxin-antitoxin system